MVVAMADPFPFAEQEWASVSDVASRIVNATLSDDFALRSVLMTELKQTLDTLRELYGDHPVLTETEADFTGDVYQRVVLYRRAIQQARQLGLPTGSIRISFARVLCNELKQPKAALAVLADCESELSTFDEHELNEFFEIKRKCERQVPSSGMS